MGAPRLISVRTDVVFETLVNSMAEAVESRFDQPLDPEVEEALAAAAADCDGRLARFGYLAREVELERFAPARAPMPWLAELVEQGPAAAVARELAAGEPSERPDPDDERAVSWRIPGPGGHVRHYLALRAAGGQGAAGKRAWLTGFLLHCCREASER